MRDMVDAIAAKQQRKDAEDATRWAVQQIATGFDADSAWLKFWGPRFMKALVGDASAPNYSASIIRDATERLLVTYEYPKPPKPADLRKLCIEVMPAPRQQARPERREPQRALTVEEQAHRENNRKRVGEMIERAFGNMNTIREANSMHGHGSPEAKRVADDLRDELQDWIDLQTEDIKREREELSL